jgi:hypothetical protein
MAWQGQQLGWMPSAQVANLDIEYCTTAQGQFQQVSAAPALQSLWRGGKNPLNQEAVSRTLCGSERLCLA